MRCIGLVMLFGLLVACSSSKHSEEPEVYDVQMGNIVCKYSKGVDLAPPAVVRRALDKRGMGGLRLQGRTVCDGVTSWNVLPEGVGEEVIPPPGMYQRVSMDSKGTVVVSPHDFR